MAARYNLMGRPLPRPLPLPRFPRTRTIVYIVYCLPHSRAFCVYPGSFLRHNSAAQTHDVPLSMTMSCSPPRRCNPLRLHLRTHGISRPFLCQHAGCGHYFSSKAALNVHARIHNGERPVRAFVPTPSPAFGALMHTL